MTAEEALQVIRERAQVSSRIVILPPARRWMAERCIDPLDVQRCLRGGAVKEDPCVPEDSRTGAYRCSAEGIIDGQRLRAVVEMPGNPPNLLVVSVIYHSS